MSYIEKEKLIKADIASIENRVRHAFNQGYDLGYKEGKTNKSENPTSSTTKNDLGVDKLISDCEKMSFDMEIFNKPLKVVALDAVKNIVKDLPSVTPQPMVIPIAEAKIDEDKLKELANKAVLTVMPQEPILDKIWSIVYPLSIMSTDKMEHEAIMKITEMLEPLHWSEEEVNE